MSDTIQVDYEGTIQVAQEMGSVGELLVDVCNRDQKLDAHLSGWKGDAATKAKASIEALHKTIGKFKDFDDSLTGFFMGAAESFTKADSKAASQIKASWHKTDS